MKLLNNTKIVVRLILGFFFTLILMGGIGLSGYLSINSIQRNLEEIYRVNLPSLKLLGEVDKDFQQVLVAERSMIFTNAKSEDFQDLIADYEKNLRQSSERFEKFKALISSEEEMAVAAEFEQARNEWEAISRQVVDNRIADTGDGSGLALDLSIGLANEKFEAVEDQLDKLAEMILQNAATFEQESVQVYENTVFMLIVIIAGGVALVLFLAIVLTRSITRQLGGEPVEVLEIATKVSQGDLTLELGENRRGTLLAMKNMNESLNGVFGQIKDAVEQVSTGAVQVSQASESLSQGATEQASSLEEISSSLNEINGQSRRNSENATEANSLAKSAVEKAGEGSRQMRELVASIKAIDESSGEIQKIVKVIDDIAFQINLLALNANVEAARAGKYGKGFAVVAEEVRNLAVRSADAVNETTQIVKESTKNMAEGTNSAELTSKQLDEIVQYSSKMADFLEEIALASKEQAQGVEQINRGLEQIDKVTQSNTANAEESASASEELASQARQLKESIATFKLTGNRPLGGNGKYAEPGNTIGERRTA